MERSAIAALLAEDPQSNSSSNDGGSTTPGNHPRIAAALQVSSPGPSSVGGLHYGSAPAAPASASAYVAVKREGEGPLAFPPASRTHEPLPPFLTDQQRSLGELMDSNADVSAFLPVVKKMAPSELDDRLQQIQQWAHQLDRAEEYQLDRARRLGMADS